MCMFVTDKIGLALPFGTASLRLVNMIRGGSLVGASHVAYQSGLETLLRVGPLSDIPATTKLVRVRFLDPVHADDTLRIGMRWEATGAAASLFPVLDADISLSPSAEHCTLSIAGTYRPPLGKLGAALDKAVLNRVATATIRQLLQRLADTLLHPAEAPDIPVVPADALAHQPVVRPSDPAD
jgi:hypothetical protein